jgi:diacylglycerol kinase (ATP)
VGKIRIDSGSDELLHHLPEGGGYFSFLFRGPILYLVVATTPPRQGEPMAAESWPGKRKKRVVRRLWDAWWFSVAGLRAAWRHEAAFREETVLFLILAPAGWWLGGSGVERALLLGSLFLVLIVELLNSAIEAVVDRLGSERHPLSGRAKDLGSAAVLVALVNAFCIWVVILFF